MRLAVCLSPRPDDPGLPADFRRHPGRWSAVVVDVLRATSTLTVALTNGARSVEAFAQPSLATARRESDPWVLVCGERNGRMVPGFDLGNSPHEYTRERVAGRALAFASTNGSMALLATARCSRRTLGAFINATAVLKRVRATEPERLLIMCAGSLGRFALEDAAFAGWLCAALAADGAAFEGAAARLVSGIAPRHAGEVRDAVEGSSHGRALRRLGEGFARDVEFCAGLDRLDGAFDI